MLLRHDHHPVLGLQLRPLRHLVHLLNLPPHQEQLLLRHPGQLHQAQLLLPIWQPLKIRVISSLSQNSCDRPQWWFIKSLNDSCVTKVWPLFHLQPCYCDAMQCQTDLTSYWVSLGRISARVPFLSTVLKQEFHCSRCRPNLVVVGGGPQVAAMLQLLFKTISLLRCSY